MKTKKSNLRRLRYGTNSTALTIVVIVAVMLLNVIVSIVANRYPLILDMSSDKIYSLSDEGINVAESVSNKVEITVFFDEATFSNPNTGATELDTTLREFYSALQQYRSHSKNNVTFQFINPNQEYTLFSTYENKYGVANGDILFATANRYKVSSVYDLYEEVTTDYGYEFYSKVEKVLASNIYNLQSDNDRIVQVPVGHNEDSYTIAGLKSLYELNGYTFEEININGSAAFSEEAEVMLIAAPDNDYTDAEIKRVHEWVYNKGNYGRHLIVYINPTADCPNLYELLDVEYGIQVTNDLLIETDENRKQDLNKYATICDIPENKYTLNSAGTANLATPLARRLTTSWESETDQDNAISYLSTALNSYPESAQLINLKDYTEYNVENVYKPEAGEYPLTSMIASTINSYNNNTQTATYGTVVVSGSCMMAYADYVRNGSFNNEELLLDSINTITGHESSLIISNKDLTTETVSFSFETQLIVGIGVFTVGIPLIVLIIALVVFLRRKHL